MSNLYKDQEPRLGQVVEMWTKGAWYAAIVAAVIPNSPVGGLHVTMFHPISGALPYQNVPFWDEQSKENTRVNSWRFIEVDED